MRVMWTSRNSDALEQAGPWGRYERIVTEADLGKYLFNWEFAIAVAGGLMDLNPFDEPDVAAAKKNTTELLRKDDVLERLTLVEGRLTGLRSLVRRELKRLGTAAVHARGDLEGFADPDQYRLFGEALLAGC